VKIFRSLAALLSKIVWTGVAVLILFAASIVLALFGHGDFAIICALWAILVVQIRVAERR
jgi:hypothetical protein